MVDLDTSETLLLEGFTQYVMTDEFLNVFFTTYNRRNCLSDEPISNWTKLIHTPWRECTGGYPGDVARVYWNLEKEMQWTTYRPLTDYDLLYFQVNEIWKWQQSTNFIYSDNASRYVFVEHPGHVFNCDLKQPSLLKPITLLENDSTLSIAGAIDQALIAPCKAIGEKKAEENTKVEIFRVVNHIAKSIFKKELSEEYFKKDTTSSTEGAELSVHQYALLLQNWTFNYLSISEKDKPAFRNQFSTSIIDALPAEDQVVMKDSIIHRAYSNWPDIWTEDAPRQIHFCSYFDLVSYSVKSGMVDGDNTNLRQMDKPGYVSYAVMNIHKMALPNRYVGPLKA